MLAHVRRTRWIIALTLLLFGQVGVVRASVVPVCPNAGETTSDSVVDSAAPAGWGAAEGVVQAETERGPGEVPALPTPNAPACGTAALPALSESASAGLLHSRDPPLQASAFAPRLLAHFFFRPPRPS